MHPGPKEPSLQPITDYSSPFAYAFMKKIPIYSWTQLGKYCTFIPALAIL